MHCLPIALATFIVVGLQAAVAGPLVLVAGGGSGGDGARAADARLDGPFGMDFDRNGNMYIVEMPGQRVLRVDRNGIFTKLGGTGEKGNDGDGAPAAKARFNGMHSLAVAANGDIYVADTWNSRIRKIDATTGTVAPFAGTGEKGFSGDGGPAEKARFGNVYCVAFDFKGNALYIADLDNRRIRKIDMRTRVVTTVAGNGQRGVPEDGADAHSAPLVDPRAVAVDARGNVYILERSGHALRVVEPNGKVRTVAGTGKAGDSGDGGDARQATLNGPKHLCIDLEGNVLIADTENHRIRKYLPKEGRIAGVAGTGKKGASGLGGLPEQAQLSQPHGVYVHPTGAIYIADSSNNRILKIEP